MEERLGTEPADRRRVERRVGQRVADLTLPEFRRIVLTSVLFTLVLGVFVWMVHTVVIAAILAVIVAIYLEPLYAAILTLTRRPGVAAALTILFVLVPLLALIAYSYVELRGAAQYIAAHQDEVVARIDEAIRRIPYVSGRSFSEQIARYVDRASNYGAEIVDGVKDALVTVSISSAVFLFTAYYVLTQRDEIVRYIRSKVPTRYGELAEALERNVRGVLYGAIYATLVTQTIKSAVILAMNLAFHVPLALVLALLSFVIGFFPIVGSWTVYLPVAIWLAIFREAWVAAATVLAVGFFGNTLFISMYLRPKLAAEKSRVLNFYWMLIALVTGVYTFGIVGILLGPIVIGLLKAVFDTVTARDNWRLLEADDQPVESTPGVTVHAAGSS